MMKVYLSNLIDNGFDFLEAGITQFESQPKYSVINFCAAIELFLKARLMSEHWSLITSNEPNINSFKNGNFRSLNFTELVPRIEAVTGEKIDRETVECFKGLANHRNKMVHFFHEAHFGDQSRRTLDRVAIEQCSGWFHLSRLLRKWDTLFSPYGEKVQQINQMMKTHEVYLDTVFERIAPEITIAKKDGVKFNQCTRCKRGASEVMKLTEFLYKNKCRVCLHTEQLIQVPCPNDGCEGVIVFDGWKGESSGVCDECEKKMSSKDLSELLNTNPSSPDSFDFAINCAACGTPDEVIEHEEYYVCMNCYYIEDSLQHCEWCSEGQIGGGDLEYSGYSGCEFCEGAQGWHKDD